MSTTALLRELAEVLARGFVRLAVNRAKSRLSLASMADVEASCHQTVNNQRRR